MGKPEMEELESRLARLGEGMQFIQLMTRAFSSLRLTERSAISDTLTSLVGTFFDCTHHATILVDPDTGELRVAASEGFARADDLLDAQGLEFWRWIMVEKAAMRVGPDEMGRRWPNAPQALLGGVACVAIDLLDESVGVIVVSQKRSGQPVTDEELTFLSCASGLASMAVSNASAHEEQEAQRLLAEARAELAAQESQEKEKALSELDQKLAIIEQQQLAIMELSTPVLQLWEDVVAMPIIGVVDTRRSAEIMERLMEEVSMRQSRYVILDITGVEVVDTKTADHFIKVARAAELLGARCIITGIRPAVAQTLVDIGVDLSTLITMGNMREGLKECLRRLRRDRALAGKTAGG